jgi:hypothetical protein
MLTAMLHPLVKVLATRPELLAGHLAGYGELMAAQASEAAAGLRLRAALAAVVLVGAGVGLGLAGVALLFVAALPLAQMPQPWLLWVVPLVPLTAAALCAWQLQRQPAVWRPELLQAQWAADAALLRQANTA